MSRCSSANTFRGSGVPSGVCTVARRSAALRRVGLKLRTPSRASVAFIRLTMRVRSPTRHSRSRFGRLASSSAIVGTRAMLQWPRSPRSHPQEPTLQQLGVEPVGLGPAMLPRYRDTRGMDHVRFDLARIQPTRQPEAIAAGFEGQCNPRDLFTGPDRFIAPAMPQAKKPFRTRFQLLLRLTLNAGKHPGNQPARLAHLDDGNDCAILVQRDEGPDQSLPRRRPGSFSWGIGALRQLFASDDGAISFAACPIPSLRWREMDSNRRYRGRRPASGRSLRAQRVETDAAKREFGSDSCLFFAALGREWWARRRSVL